MGRLFKKYEPLSAPKSALAMGMNRADECSPLSNADGKLFILLFL
jgi:hypothetical protein